MPASIVGADTSLGKPVRKGAQRKVKQRVPPSVEDSLIYFRDKGGTAQSEACHGHGIRRCCSIFEHDRRRVHEHAQQHMDPSSLSVIPAPYLEDTPKVECGGEPTVVSRPLAIVERKRKDGCCRVLHALVEASHVVVEPIRIAAQRSAEVVCERNREMCSGSNQQAYQAPALSTVSTHRHEPKNASWKKYGDSVCHLLRWGHAKAIVWIRHISYQLLSYYYMKYKYCAAALTLAAVWWPTRELRGGSAEASSTEPRSRRKPSAPPFERTHRHLEAPPTSSAIACAWSASGMDELTN